MNTVSFSMMITLRSLSVVLALIAVYPTFLYGLLFGATFQFGGLLALSCSCACGYLAYEFFRGGKLVIWLFSIVLLVVIAGLGVSFDFYDYSSSGPTELEWINVNYWKSVSPLVIFSIIARWYCQVGNNKKLFVDGDEVDRQT